MSAQAKRDTAPEVRLRSELFARRMRFRKQYPVPGLPRRTIDVAMPGRRLAVFVHGCFWHGCPAHSRATKSNTDWWAAKIARNRQRDDQTREHLEAAGWTVVTVWEHEATEQAADRIEATLSHI